MKFKKRRTEIRQYRDQSDSAQRRVVHLMAAVTAFGSGLGVNLGTAWAIDNTESNTSEMITQSKGREIQSKPGDNQKSPIEVDRMNVEHALPDAHAFKSRRGENEAVIPNIQGVGETELKK